MAKSKSRKELEATRELAYILYLNFVQNKEIAERCGVSQQTITAWVNSGNWKEKRAAKTITRTELINKTLEQINTLLSSEDMLSSKTADKLVKLAALVERLDKKNSPVLTMEVFISFTGWLQKQSLTDNNVSIDLIKIINKYQDAYITTIMNG
jgi:transposase